MQVLSVTLLSSGRTSIQTMDPKHYYPIPNMKPILNPSSKPIPFQQNKTWSGYCDTHTFPGASDASPIRDTLSSGLTLS